MKIMASTTIIVGPVGMSIRTDKNNPKIIDKIPIKEDKSAIWIGDFEICFAEAAGIINIDVINNIPTILTQVATKIISKVKKTAWIKFVFIFSAAAIFLSIVSKTSLSQITYKIINTNMVATENKITSLEVTVKISPNKYESRLTFLFNKLIETIPIDNDECANMPSSVSLDRICLFWR